MASVTEKIKDGAQKAKEGVKESLVGSEEEPQPITADKSRVHAACDAR